MARLSDTSAIAKRPLPGPYYPPMRPTDCSPEYCMNTNKGAFAKQTSAGNESMSGASEELRKP